MTDSTTPTASWTATRTPTPLATSTPTNSPTVTATAQCGQETVAIYDESGELVGNFCAGIIFPIGSTYSMTISPFKPNPTGGGGTITVYLNGQVICVWNVKSFTFLTAPNGFYRFVLVVHDLSGATITLSQDAFILTNEGQPTIQLSALPNTAHPGDTVQFYASLNGNPADSQSALKIYSIAGEWLKTLTFTNGKTSWDATNKDLQPVASGVYLAVLVGVDPNTGVKGNKIVKVLVLH